MRNFTNMLALLILLVLPITVFAQTRPYVELGFGTGGDKLTPSGSGVSIRAGEGLRFSFGLENQFAAHPRSSLRVAFNVLLAEDEDENDCFVCFFPDPEPSVSFNPKGIEAIYQYELNSQKGSAKLGLGFVYYPGPEYEYEDIEGAGSGKLDFDNATGLVLQITMSPQNSGDADNSLGIGVRMVNIDYKAAGLTFDGNRTSFFGFFGF